MNILCHETNIKKTLLKFVPSIVNPLPLLTFNISIFENIIKESFN